MILHNLCQQQPKADWKYSMKKKTIFVSAKSFQWSCDNITNKQKEKKKFFFFKHESNEYFHVIERTDANKNLRKQNMMLYQIFITNQCLLILMYLKSS